MRPHAITEERGAGPGLPLPSHGAQAGLGPGSKGVGWGETLDASAHRCEPRPRTRVPPQESVFLGPPPSQPLWMGIKKEKTEMVLPPPGRRAHGEKSFLLSVLFVGPLLPPRTCRDLPQPGTTGEGVEKTPLTVGLGTQSLGMGARETEEWGGALGPASGRSFFPFWFIGSMWGAGEA